MNANDLAVDDEIVTVDFQEMSDMIVYSLQPNGQAAIFEGPPGAGKTNFIWHIQQMCQDANPNFGSCYHNFGGSELMAGIGLPKNSNNRFSEMGIPQWAMDRPKENLRGVYRKLYDSTAHDLSILNANEALDPYPQGIACLDEPFTSPATDLQLAMAEFFCEGRFGTWQLPEQWAKIGLTNGSTHRSGVKRPFMHMRNRVKWLKVRPSLHDQCEFWRRTGMRREFILFARYEPSLVLSPNVPSEDVQFSTARSWFEAEKSAITWAVNKLGLDPDNDPLPMDDKVFNALIAAGVGSPTLSAFKSYLIDMGTAPTFEEIIASPARVPIPVDPMVQKKMADMMAFSCEFKDIDLLIECARRMDKPFAGIFGAAVGKRFGSRLARHIPFLDFMDWAGQGAKLQMNL